MRRPAAGRKRMQRGETAARSRGSEAKAQRAPARTKPGPRKDDPRKDGPRKDGKGKSGPKRDQTSWAARAGNDRWRPERAERASTPAPAPVAAAKPAAPKSLPVQMLTVGADESGMRLDRFLEVHVPALPYSVQQRIVRKGEVRVDSGRAKPNMRLEAGQIVRVPPLRFDTPPRPRPAGDGQSDRDDKDLAELRAMTLYEDDDVLVLNKPMGLAVQGGIGMVRHVDGMLGALQEPDGQRPRLVHRLDKDTAGCLLIAKTRFAATALTKTFRTRTARKIYWALVAGVPKVRQGRISTYLTKDEAAEAVGEAKMRIAKHGERDATHAVTYYAMIDHSSRICSWLSLKPVTGRTHQLRAHMNHIGNPIIGDPKYFIRENWELPPGMQNRLHLLARRIVVPHPRTGKPIDVTAPLPPHMLQSWNMLELDAAQYDPIVDAPEE